MREFDVVESDFWKAIDALAEEAGWKEGEDKGAVILAHFQKRVSEGVASIPDVFARAGEDFAKAIDAMPGEIARMCEALVQVGELFTRLKR